jgi:hypothetical protein
LGVHLEKGKFDVKVESRGKEGALSSSASQKRFMDLMYIRAAVRF